MKASLFLLSFLYASLAMSEVPGSYNWKFESCSIRVGNNYTEWNNFSNYSEINVSFHNKHDCTLSLTGKNSSHDHSQDYTDKAFPPPDFLGYCDNEMSTSSPNIRLYFQLVDNIQSSKDLILISYVPEEKSWKLSHSFESNRKGSSMDWDQQECRLTSY